MVRNAGQSWPRICTLCAVQKPWNPMMLYTVAILFGASTRSDPTFAGEMTDDFPVDMKLFGITALESML